MTKLVAFVIAAFALSLAATDVEASKKRFGGGNSIGQQRSAPAQREAAPPARPAQGQPSQAQPAQPAQAAPGKPAQPAQQGFMSKWGGVLAGLGIGALLGSLFSGGLGSIGSLLVALLAGVAIFFVIRMLMARRAAPAPAAAAPGASPVAFSRVEPTMPDTKPVVPPIGGGVNIPPIGSGLGGAQPAPAVESEPAPQLPPGFEKEAFLRVAKTSFIRLQAANDAGDLDDIRNFTTPEMFAELSMQVKERGAASQRTEVVSVEAELVEAVVEGDYGIASVRFYGLIREDDARNPEPFDEVWHVRQDLRKRNAPWLIMGIQQRD